MYRDKKRGFVLTVFMLSFLLSACAASDNLMTDTGSGNNKEIAKEEYLNVNALNNVGTDQVQSGYKVYTLEKGVYTEEVMNQTLQRTYVNAKTVNVEVEEGSIFLEKYHVDGTMIPVEEGDVIATIVTEVDEVAIEEAQLNLTRLQERYEKAYENYLDDLEELDEEKEETGNGYKLAVIDLKCEQRALDWELEKRNFELDIEEAGETIEELKNSSNTTQIKAPISGYVVFQSKYTTGTELQNGDYICHIMSMDDFTLHTNNYGHQFSYGMNLGFSVGKQTWEGRVINAGSRALYGNMDTGETVFKVDVSEDLEDLSLRQLEGITVEGNAICVENVVLVPRDAVTEVEDSCYVTVLKEDGSLLKTEFIPGGDNTEYYWVYDGLTEGTQVVYQ